MSLHHDALEVLTQWRPTGEDDQQQRLRLDFLAFLAAYPDATSRSCRAGHLTASALVVDRSTGRVLLTRHATVGRWLQLGGHCEESDADLAAAALREATEESGIAGLQLLPGPARLDRHEVRCRLGEDITVLDHLDVQFVAVAPAGAKEQAEGAAPLSWFAPDALPADADAAVRALVRAAAPR